MAEIKRVIVDTISSQIIARLKQVQSDAEPFVNDNAPDIKSTRMTLKMTINKKISQISPNCAITKKITEDLIELLRTTCSTNASLSFALCCLADKMIEHGESLVALHLPASFTLAYVAVEVGKVFGMFMDVLFASFYRRSIFTIPMYIESSDADASVFANGVLRTALGFRDVVETYEAFIERMSGVVYLFGALLVMPFVDGRLMEYAWVWLSSLLNMTPKIYTSTILCSFLEVTSYAMYSTYKRQFLKLIVFIKDIFIPLLPSASVSANTRLTLLIERFISKGFAPPEGYSIVCL